LKTAPGVPAYDAQHFTENKTGQVASLVPPSAVPHTAPLTTAPSSSRRQGARVGVTPTQDARGLRLNEPHEYREVP
jgi:hypothetical protein